jgi:hypothetical protein
LEKTKLSIFIFRDEEDSRAVDQRRELPSWFDVSYTGRNERCFIFFRSKIIGIGRLIWVAILIIKEKDCLKSKSMVSNWPINDYGFVQYKLLVGNVPNTRNCKLLN